MGPIISDATLMTMKKWKEAGFYDRATRLIYSYETRQYTEGATFDCRVILISGSPRPAPDELGQAEVKMGDCDVYFKLGVVIGSHDRIRVTHLHGQPQTPALVYDVVAGPIRESIGQRITLALMTE
jgi:hypothetical protein